MMGKIIAFHSYKGGTGKTLLSINLAATYAKNGKDVCLLDLDFRAPSLQARFKSIFGVHTQGTGFLFKLQNLYKAADRNKTLDNARCIIRGPVPGPIGHSTTHDRPILHFWQQRD